MCDMDSRLHVLDDSLRYQQKMAKQELGQCKEEAEEESARVIGKFK